MPLTVLSVAYPLARVGPDAAGGAEQVLTSLDFALHRAGHRSLVIACEGSVTAGELIASPRQPGQLNEEVRRLAQRSHARAIRDVLARAGVDVIHMHGIDWPEYLPHDPPCPVLATLHLPPGCYSYPMRALEHPFLHLNCVSRAQHAVLQHNLRGRAYLVENGVPLEALRTRVRKRGYVYALGRICPEKGLHLAVEAARQASLPIILSGELFRYPAHVDYFERKLRPSLGRAAHFTGPVGLARKRRLLAGARCVLIPSLVPETSSLVAMEALACGTPVVAFARGALPEVIEHGRTGFVVNNVDEMAKAIHRTAGIDPAECRRVARQRFSADRMARDYIALYRALIRTEVSAGAPIC